MASRAVMRHVNWTLTVAGSPLPRCGLVCETCEAAGPPGQNREALEMWALNHTARTNDHRRYRSITEVPFVVKPAPGNPLYDQEADR